MTSDQKGPSGRTGAHLTELRLKVKFLEAVSSPSPSSRERHPHKATRRLLGLMSEIDGVIHSLNLLSVLATGGAHTPHREELPCCWLRPDRLSKASNWICCVSLPTPHSSTLPTPHSSIMHKQARFPAGHLPGTPKTGQCTTCTAFVVSDLNSPGCRF